MSTSTITPNAEFGINIRQDSTELSNGIPTEVPTEPQSKRQTKLSLIPKENHLIMVNHLCTLSTLMTWPRTLFEILSEYCRDIPPVCYIFGGCNIKTTTGSVATCGRIVDDIWFDLPSMVMVRDSCGACHIGDYIYVTGGYGIYGVPTSTVERLHLPTSKWSMVQEMPGYSRTCHGCVAVDDCLYSIGGRDRGNGKAVYRYETNNNVWSKIPSTNHGRYQSSYVVLNKRIYAFGGIHCDNTCEMFDVLTSQWIDIAPMTIARHNACAVAVGDKILLLGGRSTLSMLDTVDEYTPTSNSWRELTWTLPRRDENFAAWYDSSNKALYIASGHQQSALDGIIYMRNPIDIGEWTVVTTWPKRFTFGWTIVA
jgi:N-acetylneuraminic acid mutarotase